VSQGPQVGHLSTDTTSRTVGPRDAIAISDSKVESRISSSRCLQVRQSDFYLPELQPTGLKVELQDTIASLNLEVQIILSY